MEIIESIRNSEARNGRQSVVQMLENYINLNSLQMNHFFYWQTINMVPNTNGLQFFMHMQLKSRYFASRIIGRRGSIINQVKQLSGTRISSPNTQYLDPFTAHFQISGANPFDIYFAALIISALGIHFVNEFQNNISPRADEITHQFLVDPALGNHLMMNHADQIAQIDQLTRCRIIKPKYYSIPFVFYLIGKPENVNNAIAYLQSLIHSSMNVA